MNDLTPLLELAVTTPFLIFIARQQDHWYFKVGLYAVAGVTGLSAYRRLTATPDPPALPQTPALPQAPATPVAAPIPDWSSVG